MADAATTTPMSRWHMLMARRDELVHNLEGAPDDREAIVEQLAAVDEVLLNEPAPDVGSTLFKLELLWDGQVDGNHEDAQRKRRILDELRSAITV